jgi:hypothetical protein
MQPGTLTWPHTPSAQTSVVQPFPSLHCEAVSHSWQFGMF